MLNIKFATEENIKQPKGALVLEAPKPEDWVLGGIGDQTLKISILKGGHWTPFVPAISEIQVAADGDTYGCTCFSDNNIDETLHICQEKEEINISDRDVTVGSGTKRGVGNTMAAAPEYKRKNSFLLEDEMPFPKSMTLDQFYATKRTPEQKQIVESRLLKYSGNYFWVRDLSQKGLLSALETSPLKVAIEGAYYFDENGRIKNASGPYSHAVMVFDYILDAQGNVTEWWVMDSENSQYIRLRGDYKFGAVMVKTFQKKNMRYKIKGNPLVLQLDPVSRTLVPYLSGKVYKVLNGTVDYQGITEVATVKDLPYPLADWAIQDIGWDSRSFTQ